MMLTFDLLSHKKIVTTRQDSRKDDDADEEEEKEEQEEDDNESKHYNFIAFHYIIMMRCNLCNVINMYYRDNDFS